MYSLVICDDEPTHAEFLKSQIQNLGNCARAFEITLLDSVPALERFIAQRDPPDVLMMDIVLGERDGVDAVFRLLGNVPRTQVIYITGYPENCTRVYETRHIYFLKKPVDADSLGKALRASAEKLAEYARENISIKCGAEIRLIPIAEIVYIESERRKLLIHTTRETYTTYAKLDEIVPLCGGGFVRCHKSFCVNFAHAAALTDHGFLMKNGETVLISQQKYRLAKQAFLSWLEEKL